VAKINSQTTGFSSYPLLCHADPPPGGEVSVLTKLCEYYQFSSDFGIKTGLLRTHFFAKIDSFFRLQHFGKFFFTRS
jgi:hypothetical protein